MYSLLSYSILWIHSYRSNGSLHVIYPADASVGREESVYITLSVYSTQIAFNIETKNGNYPFVSFRDSRSHLCKPYV